MAANCAAIENAGKWRGCLPGCTTSADSSLDGNTTSRTSSPSSTLPAFTCCSDIYETSSRAFEGFTLEDWLQKHTAVSDDDFIKDPMRNRLAVVMNRTSHASYHAGQAVLTK